MSLSRSPIHLTATIANLCSVAAVYGIGFGIWMLPTALFVGPHLLMAAAAHIALGAAYLWTASAIRHGKPRALPITILCAVLTTTLASIALIQSIIKQEIPSLMFWGPLTVYFLCLAVLSVRRWLAELKTITMERPQNGPANIATDASPPTESPPPPTPATQRRRNRHGVV